MRATTTIAAILIGLAGCAKDPSASLAMEAETPGPPAIELTSATPGEHGRLNIPHTLLLLGSGTEGHESVIAGPGTFEILEVYRDPTAWDCEWPPIRLRIRMLDGDQSGLEGWLLLSRLSWLVR